MKEIKGKTTIQLFNAKTGKEIERHTDDNMVTNLYPKLFEFGFKSWRAPWFSSTSQNNQMTKLSMMKPSDFVGGIQLFDSALIENPNLILPQPGVGCIGHAGGDYAGTDPYRGDLNASESGIITNGYKYVWDFATDKANGIIRSVAMTSLKGGNSGYRSDTFFGTSDAIAIQGWSPSDAQPFTFNITKYTSLQLGRPLWVTDDFLEFAFQATFSGTIRVKKYKSNDISQIGFNDYPWTNQNDSDDMIKTLSSSEYLTLNDVDGELYGLLYNSSTKTLYLKTYNRNNLSELSSVTLVNGATQMELVFYQLVWGIVAGKVYVMGYSQSPETVPRVLHKFDAVTGANEGTIELPAALGTYREGDFGGINFNSDRICFAVSRYPPSGSNRSMFMYLFDGTKFLGGISDYWNSTYTSWFYAKLLHKDYPIIIAPGYYGYNGYFLGWAVGIFAHALFTINNLASPVIKTSANTMKVTYQITW